MDNAETIRRLAAITDQGAFERLATAVLRESDSQYRLLTHPGVNADGKTVKSQVDGIMFIPGANPPHMIAVHHTTSARADLEKKWLHDPATVQPRKGSKPTALPGDVVKTLAILREERKRTPNLRATLILTTNQEPPEDVVREVHAAGQSAGLAIEIWSRSALAHFLHFESKGQWIRRDFLGIEQERMSPELLRELSKRSLEYSRPGDEADAWIERTLDDGLARTAGRDVVFIVGDSGIGKSVACYKRLKRHVEAGGFGLVLPHDAVAASLSLDQALDAALRQLHPALRPGSGSEARVLASEHTPLLVVIEDVNQSGQPALLLEKLAGWSTRKEKSDQWPIWQILCPVWARIVSSLRDEPRKRITALSLEGARFSADEGAAAVQRRRERAGVPITRLEAEAVSAALGHDPLLIAIHDPVSQPNPNGAVAQFVDSSLGQLATSRGEFTPGEYRQSLRLLASSMLKHRHLDLTMEDILGWWGSSTDTSKVRHVALFGEIIRIVGPSSAERLAFRHDRVRDWLLADAAAESLARGNLPDTVLEDPYFAEILGAALSRDELPSVIPDIKAANPLALFHSLRLMRSPESESYRSILAAARDWLATEGASGEDTYNLRWEALRALSEAESPEVIALVQQFREANSYWALRARFRNGDIGAGVELCRQHEPGVRLIGHVELIEYVQRQYGRNLVRTLDGVLRRQPLPQPVRIGALRLAGDLGDPALADAIEASWHSDCTRNLTEYLWACAECCENNPAQLLDPVCNAWAALPNERTKDRLPTPREEVAADHIRWAFNDRLPNAAVRYFVERAKSPELRWPLTYMLHGVDDPDAVEFVAREMAEMEESLKGTNRFSPFVVSAKDEWSRRQEREGRPMSAASRNRLLRLWQDVTQTDQLRRQAFRLWSACELDGDIPVLRAVPATDPLGDSALWERLRRGDRRSIRELIGKLRTDDRRHWWHLGRHVWSDELTAALDDEFAARAASASLGWDTKDDASPDWITSKLVIRLPIHEAEAMLLRHWDHLRFSPYFIQAGLYVATPRLRHAVAKAVSECPEPASLFKHLGSQFGLRTSGHPGVTRIAQIEGLLPYLDHLQDVTIYDLWETCNDHAWYDLRRRHLDNRLKANYRDFAFTDDALAVAELDKMHEAGRVHWVDLWVDHFLKSGVTLDHLMIVVRNWLGRQQDIAALKLASNIVIHAGRRSDIEVLAVYTAGPPDDAAVIVANATFAVKRRSLA